ncbi:hypothetical protein [Polyangium sp. y55x31]|uniref:hypothetical protein n=1 Tax=Polyangium sp. y55x31 TaxID=3042688 RepID=UPI002482D39E|nr:hypothetical protein [Polyangium sp. y55x31]MDI1481914.1 hypothetical protein [Polyangium sp. y55x31]
MPYELVYSGMQAFCEPRRPRVMHADEPPREGQDQRERREQQDCGDRETRGQAEKRHSERNEVCNRTSCREHTFVDASFNVADTHGDRGQGGGGRARRLPLQHDRGGDRTPNCVSDLKDSPLLTVDGEGAGCSLYKGRPETDRSQKNRMMQGVAGVDKGAEGSKLPTHQRLPEKASARSQDSMGYRLHQGSPRKHPTVSPIPAELVNDTQDECPTGRVLSRHHRLQRSA